MPNRLANETSPYLLQHADNPVDWHPWGPEALERARREDKPILLSIGYAACHWCHVMEHESFEDEETARLMNEHFVNIKVDREERPDLDAIYMTAVQAMTGHGGWPMTVFLTPEGTPFYGGTYFPPDDRHGVPSFRRVMQSVYDAYTTRRGDIERTAQQVKQLYEQTARAASAAGSLTPVVLEQAYRSIARQYDVRHGGLTGAPKFPQAMSLDFLVRYWGRTDTGYALEMAAHSFRMMARGGIYDQVGGGFHRYSVDAVWLVPHFEKMLYDNALLARLGVHLVQATDDAEFRRVTEDVIDWVAREMTSPEGGFYSSLDADSEGEEGKFYVWSLEELESLLGADAALVTSYFGASAQGNFEGHNILHVPNDPAAVASRAGMPLDELERVVAGARRTLLDTRTRRVWPGRDEKILAGWNGLMLTAVAEVARVLDRADYRALALRNGHFLFGHMVSAGRVLRSHKDGTTRINGFLEDYAAVGLGALALYELTFDSQWLDRARELARSAITWFWDEEGGVFFDTSSDHETLVTRPREVTDNAIPSGNSLAADLLLRVADLTGDVEMRRIVSRVLESLAAPMERYAAAFGHLLGVADMAVHGAVEVALIGEPGDPHFQRLSRLVASRYVPALVLAGGPPAQANIALLADRPTLDSRATAYVCRSAVCEMPVTEEDDLVKQLRRAGRVR
ncbi:MAG TPA: thioredoxin domain-containing protein [Gemmatimonadaceae bacterium]|nr:thioredoxin domain-containing protein [Gemmatimonadaceae bacterium]